VHWVPVLWSVESHAERREVAEFASPSCPEFPDGTVGRPPPCGPRTPGLAELQGRLETLHRWRNPNRSGVGPVVSPGGRRCPPVETGPVVSALAVAQELNSQVNLVGRPRQVARKRPGLAMALGKIPVSFPGGRTTRLDKPKARKEAGGHFGSERTGQRRRAKKAESCAKVRGQAEAEWPCVACFGTRSSPSWISPTVEAWPKQEEGKQALRIG
jgi:hypothetical protein